MTDARYVRQTILADIGEAGQAALGDASVAIVGLGGLGCPAAACLAGAGVGRLTLVDHDQVALSNLQRQTLYAQCDVGQPKTQAAAARLQAMNPSIAIDAHHTRLTEAVLADLPRRSDVMLDCTDNFPSRFSLNAATRAARVPLVSGAAIGWRGQLGVFRNDKAGAACYRCLFPEAGEAAERCEDAGVLGPVVATIGQWQALEAIKLLVGLARPDSHWLHWDARDYGLRHHAVPHDPDCPEHAPA